jgi:hypothetical protein
MVVDLVPNLDPLRNMANHSAGENERKSKMKKVMHACMQLYKHDLEHNHSELHYIHARLPTVR